MAHVIHVGHSIHSGKDFSFEYALDLGDRFLMLPNLYGISVIHFDGMASKVVATILVKTDLGQSKNEVGSIYAGVKDAFNTLRGLPTQNVTLRCTKTNLAAGVIPDEHAIEKMLSDIYLLNSTGGSA